MSANGLLDTPNSSSPNAPNDDAAPVPDGPVRDVDVGEVAEGDVLKDGNAVLREGDVRANKSSKSSAMINDSQEVKVH